MILPTTGGIRSDRAGDGRYGALRGPRRHLGTDYRCYLGEPVSAPMSGEMYRLAIPYANDTRWSGAAIRNSEYELLIFYFDPLLSLIGSYVSEGDLIGHAQAISKKYEGKGMQDHVHIQVRKRNGDWLDFETLV